MKATKLLLTVAACLLTTLSALGQGRIAFANDINTRIYVGLGGNPGSFVVLGTASTAAFGFGPASVEVRLFAGMTFSSLSPVLIGTAADQQFVLNTASTVLGFQGLFNGGNVLPLPGTDGTTPIFLQMRLDAMPTSGPYSGVHVATLSPIIQVTPLLSPNPGTSVFGLPGTPDVWDASDWSFEGTGPGALTLRIGIPEPSAMALTASTFAVMFWRRKMR